MLDASSNISLQKTWLDEQVDHAKITLNKSSSLNFEEGKQVT